MGTITITVTGDAADEVRDKVLSLASLMGGAAAECVAENGIVVENHDVDVDADAIVEEAAAEGKPKRKRRTKAEIEAEKASEQTSEPEPEVEAVPAPASATVDDCRAALKAVNDKLGMEEAVKILQQFGADRVSELDESKFGEFVAECGKVVA